MTDDLDARRTALAELNVGVSSCIACPLSKGRTRAVPGEGPVDAEIMFIGEAPGYYEDQQGRPFVGAAGQFLEQLLASIGLKRTDVFIANVIKCRPPQNRDPLPEEISACSGFLARQIEIIDPKAIVTLGRYSLSKFLPGTPISKIHGQGRKVGEALGSADVPSSGSLAPGQPATHNRRRLQENPRLCRASAAGAADPYRAGRRRSAEGAGTGPDEAFLVQAPRPIRQRDTQIGPMPAGAYRVRQWQTVAS